MNNFIYLTSDSKQLLRDIVEAKNESEEKDRLTELLPTLEMLIDKYESAFECGRLLDLVPYPNFTERDKKLLLNLYENPSTKFTKIRNEIFCNNSEKRCPNCGAEHPKTLDHFLPKSLFPEYSITVKNLIPCCYECNGIKGTSWSQITQLYLNPYIDFDNIGFKRYLAANFSCNGDKSYVAYSVDNLDAIPELLMKIIESHIYEHKLIERYARYAKDIYGRILRILKKAKNVDDVVRWKDGELYGLLFDEQDGRQNDYSVRLQIAIFEKIEEIYEIVKKLHNSSAGKVC